jgi:L-threonylcarbamoyladenylate synthase
MALDPARYARDLYAHLHALEQGPCLRILVEAPPGGAAWQAVKDRLQRAAHDTVP